MKHLSLICCLLLPILVHAQLDLKKRINYAIENASLEEAIDLLKEKSDIRFAYSSSLLESDRRVSLKLTNAQIASILDMLLEQTDIAYRPVGRQVVLFRREQPKRKFTISGYISDQQNGEYLIGANIFKEGTGQGTASNNYGFFSLTLPEGTHDISFSYLGYETARQRIVLYDNQRLTVALNPSLTLSEVVVTASPANPGATLLSQSIGEDLTPERFQTLPALGGEVDVIRLAHLLPGVQTGADGVGGIYVRGGNADQNLVLLDGVPVYNPTHLAGIFSVFNSSAVKSAQLIKGSFPARFGGRLSSVLDIWMKEGNRKAYRSEINLGLTGAKFSLEGPLKKDTSSFFVSGRRSYMNIFIRPISERIKEDRGQTGESTYDFYDLNAKVNVQMGPRDQIFLSFYNGKDDFHNDNARSVSLFDDLFRYEEESSQDLDWGNTIGSFRWNHLFGDKLFAKASINYSRYFFQSRDINTYQDTFLVDQSSVREFNVGQFQSEIEDLGARLEFDYVLSPRHYLRFGGEAIRHRFKPGVATLSGDLTVALPDLALLIRSLEQIDNPNIQAGEYSAFIEDDWMIGKRWRVNAGLRTSAWRNDRRTYGSVEPRLSAIFQQSERLRWNASFSYMTQYLHLLTSSGIGLPNDLWVPTTARVAPQRSWMTVAGVDFSWKPWLHLKLDAYYKKLNNIISYQEGGSLTFLNADNWENNVTTGTGESYGLETQLQQSVGKTTGWLAYTLSRTTRQFDQINLAKAFPFRYDRTHNIKAVLIHQLNRSWEFSTNWVYGSGLATTLPVSEYLVDIPDFLPEIGKNFGDKNSLRLPPYHRLDIGFNYLAIKKELRYQLGFGVYNVYNRQNPLYYRVGRSGADPNDPRARQYLQVSLVPTTPYLSFSIQF